MGLAAIGLIAATSPDTAVIIGERGPITYQITVDADGTASMLATEYGSRPVTLPETSFRASSRP